MILVDSNIWIDLIQEDTVWLDWSLAQLQKARAQNRVVINPFTDAAICLARRKPP